MSLPTPTSSNARRALRQAWKELGALISPAESQNFEITTIYDVRKACETIEDELSSRGLMRNLRRLMPFFAGMQHFSKSIDVLCNGTPFLPWAWAPVTVILKIASDYVEALDVLVKVYSLIGESLGRFERLGRVFAEDHGMQEVLAVFYCDILQFHKLAYKSVRRSSWKILFTTTWGRFERRFGNIIENLKRHGDLVDKEAVARHIDATQRTLSDLSLRSLGETRETLERLESSKTEHLERVKREEKETAARQYLALTSALQLNEADQVAILDSHLHADRYDGTCSWALKQKQLKSWLGTNDRPRSLWLHGKAGSGKSVLAAHLINYQVSQGLTAAYHFCADDYASSKSYEQILRSLIRQLLQSNDEATSHAYKTVVLDRKSIKTVELEKLLQELLLIASDGSSDNGAVWVVLDGIDACYDNKLSRLCSLVRRVVAKSTVLGHPVCKVLFTSRQSQSIGKDLGRIPVVSLGEEHQSLQSAIRIYISQRLQDRNASSRLRELDVGAGDLQTLETSITEKSDGMFLYARLILDFLLSQWFVTKDELIASVAKLPPTLERYYEKILKQIVSHLDSQSSDRLRSVLRWIAYSRRPLRQLEFLSAVTFSSGDPDVKNLVPNYFLEDCAGLVVERHDATLGFIHLTVKEFLASDACSLQITEQDAILEQAIATMSCLIAISTNLVGPIKRPNALLNLIKGLFGLAVYSSQYWCDAVLYLSTQSLGELETYPTVITLATRLVSELDTHGHGLITPSLSKGDIAENIMTGLQYLHRHLQLKSHIETFFYCRSDQGLERSFEDSPDGLKLAGLRTTRPDGTSKIISVYQDCVRRLLLEDHYPGISAETFEHFKAQLETGAYTCRLRLCPFATGGLKSQRCVSQHELDHSRRPRCSVPGCQFPPFRSLATLETHIKKHHSIPSPKRKALPQVQVAMNAAADASTDKLSTIQDRGLIRGIPQLMGRSSGNSAVYHPAAYNALTYSGTSTPFVPPLYTYESAPPSHIRSPGPFSLDE